MPVEEHIENRSSDTSPGESHAAQEPLYAGQGSLYAGRYVVGPVLGQGGTCCVYRAWDTHLKRYVALKRLEPPLSEDEHIRARFAREGKAIGRLSHPSIVTLLDRGSTETEEYLVFEYVEGHSLKDFLAINGPLDVKEAGQVIGQIAEGLSHVHLLGLVHRDVKPQNILLDSELRARLTDFGIATGPDWTRVTRVGAVVGSTRYMSPEQIQGRPVDRRSDVYSLGLVFYETLTGKPAFDGTTIAEIGRKQLREKPQPLHELRPAVSEAVERVIMRCLEKLPENRFQSMDELLGALVGLGLYEPKRMPGSLLDFLLGGRDDSLSDSLEWVPPDDVRLPLPEGTHAPSRRAAGRTRRRVSRRSRTRLWAVAGIVIALAVVGIVLSLTLGSPAVAPDVVGLTLDEARDAAAKVGYKIEVVKQIPAVDATAGVVTAQEPDTGVSAPDGTVKVTVTRTAVPVGITRLTDVDPEGDASENPSLLALAMDGDVATAWTTEVYKTSDFSGLKSGVGVAFELDRPATLVKIVSSGERWAGTLLAPEQAGGQVREVARLGGKTVTTIQLSSPLASGRIWITKLDKTEEGSFQVGLCEVAFFQ